MRKATLTNDSEVIPDIPLAVQEMRLFDDRFMVACLRDSKECVQLILRIILKKSDLVVKKVQEQKAVKNLIGRDVGLDIYATDSRGKVYNIEVQRANKGAGRKRARYHVGMIDTRTLKHGQDFDALPELYVIFITEKDVFKKGLPIYRIERRIEETGELFDDKAHIVYVNGACRNLRTKLGRLMIDFSCKNADDMNYPLLAERVRYLKETQEGAAFMSDYLDRIIGKIVAQATKEASQKAREEGLEKGLKEGREEGASESKTNCALNLLRRGGIAIEEIAALVGLSTLDVQKLAKQK